MKAAMTSLALRSRSSRRVAALLCLGLFLLVQVFAASNALHNSLHADAASPGHHCVITLVSQGQLSPTNAFAGCLVIVLAFLFSSLLIHSAPVATFEHRLAPTRGPPRS